MTMTKTDRTLRSVLCLVLCALGACASSTPRPETRPEPRPEQTKTTGGSAGGSPTAAKLIADLDAWDKTVQVREGTAGHGLGESEVLVEGTPVWPPEGPSCAELVACCQGFVGQDVPAKAMRLACQFSVAKAPDCPRAIETIETIVK